MMEDPRVTEIARLKAELAALESVPAPAFDFFAQPEPAPEPEPEPEPGPSMYDVAQDPAEAIAATPGRRARGRRVRGPGSGGQQLGLLAPGASLGTNAGGAPIIEAMVALRSRRLETLLGTPSMPCSTSISRR
jgi:hypothetical protein